MAARKKYTLVGVDCNAYSVIGYVRNAMRESGFSQQEISEYVKSATSGDYNNLLAVSCDYIYQCNGRK